MFQRDSHLKAVQATALRLSAQYPDAQIQFYGIDSNPEVLQGVNAVDISSKSLEQLSGCDYLICCLGGYLLNKTIKQYQNSKTKVIALFPGVVSHFQLDAFISRFNADQVWLNCPADEKFYKTLCKVFGVKNNGILYGACWVNTINLPIKNPASSISIFFEQTQIVSNRKTAYQLQKQLFNLFQSNPQRQYLYKIRNNFYNEYLLGVRQSVQSLPNVIIVDELIEQDLVLADEFLSISSSAMIEGLLWGKHCYLLGKEYLDSDNAEIYSRSNLFLDGRAKGVDKYWMKERVFQPVKVICMATIKKQAPKEYTHRNFLNIKLWIIKLCFKYPKMIRLLLNSQRMLAIQKSLEYLSQLNIGYCESCNHYN